MTIYHIIWNNMKRNIRNYHLYISATTFSVFILYLFSSITYNKQIKEAVHISRRVTDIFSVTQIVVGLFAFVFVWYSNTFFMKKRQKEIALYGLMGLKKRRIAWFIILENSIIVGLALVIGIGMGSLFSKLFMMALFRLLREYSYVKLVFSWEAAQVTARYFTVIFLLASLRSLYMIYRVRIITLFSKEKQGEKTLRRHPIMAVISLLAVLYGYYLSQGLLYHNFVPYAAKILTSVILGTYGLFGYALTSGTSVLKRRKGFFYKGTNMLALTSLAYRIRSHTIILATITVLSATTIVSLGMVNSMYYDFISREKLGYPYTFVYDQVDEEREQQIEALIEEASDQKLLGAMTVTRAQISSTIEELTNEDMTFLYGRSLGTYYMISKSAFNQMMDIRDLPRVEVLGHNECLVSIALQYVPESLIGHSIHVNIGNKPYKTMDVVDMRMMCMVMSDMSSNYLVVSDSVYEEAVAMGATTNSYKVVALDKPLRTKALADSIRKILPKEAVFESYYYAFKDMNETNAVLMFIAFFIGILFLISTGSIIYFKLITEATDEKQRFDILRKIGVSKRDQLKVIKKQLLMIYIVPLTVGLIHSAYALSAFDMFLVSDISIPVGLTMIGYSAIYTGYYRMTVRYYRKRILRREWHLYQTS